MINDPPGKLIRENLGETKTITINITETLLAKLDDYAQKNNYSNRSWAVEEILTSKLLK